MTDPKKEGEELGERLVQKIRTARRDMEQAEETSESFEALRREVKTILQAVMKEIAEDLITTCTRVLVHLALEKALNQLSQSDERHQP